MSSVFDLRNKVAIVTGGGTGIGRGITLQFARAGAILVVGSRKEANLDLVADEVKKVEGQCLIPPVDIRVPGQVDNLFKETADKFGRVDILVNNAGASFVCPPEEITSNGWDTIININLKGTFLCCQAAGKIMMKQNQGRIINIASTAGINGWPEMAHYAAAKAGVVNLTKSLAMAWAKHNINVNCIAPGMIKTEGATAQMHWSSEDLGNGKKQPFLDLPGHPEDIAYMACFLAAEASRHITGELFVVRGNQVG